MDEKKVLPRSDSERINEEHAPKSIYRRIRGVIERRGGVPGPDDGHRGYLKFMNSVISITN